MNCVKGESIALRIMNCSAAHISLVFLFLEKFKKRIGEITRVTTKNTRFVSPCISLLVPFHVGSFSVSLFFCFLSLLFSVGFRSVPLFCLHYFTLLFFTLFCYHSPFIFFTLLYFSFLSIPLPCFTLLSFSFLLFSFLCFDCLSLLYLALLPSTFPSISFISIPFSFHVARYLFILPSRCIK